MPRFMMGVWPGHDRERFVAKTLPELTTQLRQWNGPPRLLYAHESLRTDCPELFAADYVRPFACDLEHHTWLPKLAMMEHAIRETGESICWLDLDARFSGPLPTDFWGLLAARGPIAMKLRQFRTRRCPWRASQPRCLPWAAMVYCRDAELVAAAGNYLRQSNKRYYNEEVALAHAIDDATGGWQGLDYWHDHFEMPWTSTPGELWPATTDVFRFLGE